MRIDANEEKNFIKQGFFTGLGIGLVAPVLWLGLEVIRMLITKATGG